MTLRAIWELLVWLFSHYGYLVVYIVEELDLHLGV